MMYALSKDIEGLPLQAIVAYESLRSDCPLVEELVYVNLSLLYWLIASDYGFSSYHKVSSEFREQAGREYPIVIEQGIAAYPNSLELKFWARYFPHRHYDAPFMREDCESLVSESTGETSLVPYFFLYMFDNEKYRTERDELLEQCRKLPTTKNIYISSLIE